MKAEPRTILRFLLEYFDIVKDLFDAQNKVGLITFEAMNDITSKHKIDVKIQLLEYKIVSNLNENYSLRPVYSSLIEFILSEFKPLLPETIEKYHVSIGELFRKIRENINGDKIILNQRIVELSNEINSFYEVVEKNTIALLNETRELKANVKKVNYREKIIRASRWIDEYIIPLNKILDVNHASSITTKLFEISEYTNRYRLNFDDESTRIQFEKLYFSLIQVNDNLLRQSKILTNELLPLIERIRTESIILTGWINFLKNPYKQKVPKLLETKRNYIYSKDTFFNASEFFDAFKNDEDIFIEEEEVNEEKWIFDKGLYKAKLQEHLPVNDFFKWCSTTLKDDYQKVEIEKFFALTSLAFEDDLQLEYPKKAEFHKIKINDLILTVPKITINQHGIS